MSRKEIVIENAVATGPYSQGIDAGEFIYLSGQTAIDPNTKMIIDGGVAEQTHQCFKNLISVLKGAGLTLEDVVKVNVYLTDMEDFKAMNDVYATYFNKPYPARTTIAVLALPLYAAVEIEMVAKRK